MPKLDHVALQVSGLDRAIKFYRDVLGLTLRSQQRDEAHGEAFAFFALEGGDLELLQCIDPATCHEAVQRISPLEPFCPHVAIGVEDLDAALRHLESHGITPLKGPLEIPGQVRWMYFADPDNNVIEYVQWLQA